MTELLINYIAEVENENKILTDYNNLLTTEIKLLQKEHTEYSDKLTEHFDKLDKYIIAKNKELAELHNENKKEIDAIVKKLYYLR